jgi:hypothetical protein
MGIYRNSRAHYGPRPRLYTASSDDIQQGEQIQRFNGGIKDAPKNEQWAGGNCPRTAIPKWEPLVGYEHVWRVAYSIPTLGFDR